MFIRIHDKATGCALYSGYTLILSVDTDHSFRNLPIIVKRSNHIILAVSFIVISKQ